jgi:ADP-heptose:LPS heptosyltransferase
LKTGAHLLIIRLSALGDVAMTIPVIRAFLHKYPNVKITFLSKPFLKPLFADLEQVQFLPADVKGKHQGFLGIFKLFFQLKKMNFDAVLDMHNVLRSIILRNLFLLSLVKVVSIDKGRREKRALTRPKNKIFKPLKTTHERYADLFRKLGYKLNLESKVKPPARALSPQLSDQLGKKDCNWVGIAPFAQYSSKMYPLEQMKKVIEILSQKENVQLFLFGGGVREVELLSEIAVGLERTTCVAGQYPFADELAIISNLDCMVSMDSGNGHFSAMFHVPTLTLWGVTHPYSGFAPFQQPDSNFLLPNLDKYPLIPCSIYGNKIAPGYDHVMEDISPELVVEKIEQILTRES